MHQMFTMNEWNSASGQPADLESKGKTMSTLKYTIVAFATTVAMGLSTAHATPAVKAQATTSVAVANPDQAAVGGLAGKIGVGAGAGAAVGAAVCCAAGAAVGTLAGIAAVLASELIGSSEASSPLPADSLD